MNSNEDGTLFVGESRVTLETVLARFHQSHTPEEIQAAFPTLNLADIYSVIAYYLMHKNEVDAYL